jgi:BirA family biotin operon repressor/biotin-[acetyl-CoA-carboxylase] ligase
MDRLDESKIRVAGLQVRVVERCDSTSTRLREETSAAATLLAAEVQTAGRGRHGRRWRAARGSGATFSIRRRMACGQRRLAGLSIAIGIAAVRALRRLGARGVSLKWPNDVMVKRRKLAGILVETLPAARGSLVIVGIGINCRRQPRLDARLGRGIAALEDLLRRPLPRNRVIGEVAGEVAAALAAWDRSQAGADTALEKAA